MKKLCFVATTDFVFRAFLINHLKVLSKYYEITVIVNASDSKWLKEFNVNANVIHLNISREINLIVDLLSLIKLIQLFNKNSYDAIHSITPKAGLLAMLAAKLCDIPLRVHTFTGQVWATNHGLKGFTLKKIDTFFASLATHLIVDSPSQLDFLLKEKVVSKEKTYVFGKGSVSGVNLTKFRPDSEFKSKTRSDLNIPSEAIVFLFLGRLTIDKGVLDLANAFNMLSNNSTYLLFVGPDEQGVTDTLKEILAQKSNFIRFINYTNIPEKYMNTADVLTLPSYREGFGSVVIEAAAVGIPTIASRIYGITDAIVDNQTGLLHECKNTSQISEKMQLLADNSAMRLMLGHKARLRAIKDFDANFISEKWLAFYKTQLPTNTINNS